MIARGVMAIPTMKGSSLVFVAHRASIPASSGLARWRRLGQDGQQRRATRVLAAHKL